MKDTVSQRKDDIPLPIAVALLLVIVVVSITGNKTGSILKDLSDLSVVFEDHFSALSVIVIIFSIAMMWITTQWQRHVKLTKQGTRLQSLIGKRARSEINWNDVAVAMAAGFISFGIGYLMLKGTNFAIGASALQRTIWDIVRFGSSLLLSVSAFILFFAIKPSFMAFLCKKEAIPNELGEFPRIPNTITIGSIKENEENAPPEWLTLGKTALCGNILVTGSIGAGKTQGTTLTYVEQILNNFAPHPSLMVIDPKGTFAAETLKIIKRKGLLERLLHFNLGGSTKFNPIYVPKALQNARFMDVAYMISSAASNFMGKSSDSSFWEVNSFTLIKNALAYCIAKNEYYTFLDLHAAILLAVDDRLQESLLEIIQTRTFTEEEKFNLTRAHEYFDGEFRALDKKVKSSILATATSFLNQFQEFQAHKIFCPKKDEATITSLDEAVDKGLFVVMDIASPSLAKSMGTLLKLLYEQSVLDRLKYPSRGREAAAVLLVDEYQDVVTVSNGSLIGDEKFFAKAREANAVSIVATQSFSSLQNAIGSKSATESLLQCFRTRIAAHSADAATIQSYQELIGYEDREKMSHSFSESSQNAELNHVMGGFESKNANISESVSKTLHRESVVTGKEFFSLTSFESIALVYDGVKSSFHKLFLKPYFLEDKRLPHRDLLARMAQTAALAIVFTATAAQGFPNICSVVKSTDFATCMEFKVSACTCGFPPRPCAQFNYYIPTSFVEVHPNPGETFFSELPAARAQLSTLAPIQRIPFGAEADDDTQSFQAHTLAIPMASTIMQGLPCGASFRDKTCFESMSEHLGPNWSTGASDKLQPNFLAWLASPKACLLAGAARSIAGIGPTDYKPGKGTCSVPIPLPQFPPSSHEACNGWGTFYPRTGSYTGPSQTAGALMVAVRMKSLASEVFESTPTVPGEKWQMITPQSSSCFREGENLAPLETFKRATELGRLAGNARKGFLFAVWQPVSCCRDLGYVPASQAVLTAIKAACAGGGP